MVQKLEILSFDWRYPQISIFIGLKVMSIFPTPVVFPATSISAYIDLIIKTYCFTKIHIVDDSAVAFSRFNKHYAIFRSRSFAGVGNERIKRTLWGRQSLTGL